MCFRDRAIYNCGHSDVVGSFRCHHNGQGIFGMLRSLDRCSHFIDRVFHSPEVCSRCGRDVHLLDEQCRPWEQMESRALNGENDQAFHGEEVDDLISDSDDNGSDVDGSVMTALHMPTNRIMVVGGTREFLVTGAELAQLLKTSGPSVKVDTTGDTHIYHLQPHPVILRGNEAITSHHHENPQPPITTQPVRRVAGPQELDSLEIQRTPHQVRPSGLPLDDGLGQRRRREVVSYSAFKPGCLPISDGDWEHHAHISWLHAPTRIATQDAELFFTLREMVVPDLFAGWARLQRRPSIVASWVSELPSNGEPGRIGDSGPQPPQRSPSHEVVGIQELPAGVPERGSPQHIRDDRKQLPSQEKRRAMYSPDSLGSRGGSGGWQAKPVSPQPLEVRAVDCRS
ncbi:hypothetical protein NKR23_g450 [Pleurostoma richardsiae]|uniref:Uncharacterized protein n=1 Tax=Pleurostoma richardsiae TaxID=41990 RepID=A0AA38S7C3_9PEZI|nr:hypothetical protein NKR23_g450 [Pleurostoma richardsiae]